MRGQGLGWGEGTQHAAQRKWGGSLCSSLSPSLPSATQKPKNVPSLHSFWSPCRLGGTSPLSLGCMLGPFSPAQSLTSHSQPPTARPRDTPSSSEVQSAVVPFVWFPTFSENDSHVPQIVLHFVHSLLWAFPWGAVSVLLPASELLEKSTCQTRGRRPVNACLKYKYRECLVTLDSPVPRATFPAERNPSAARFRTGGGAEGEQAGQRMLLEIRGG